MSDARSVKTLDQRPVEQLSGVGPALAEKLARLHILTLQDLLFHLPQRYQDRTRITPIGALRPGADVVIEGEVRASDVVFGKRRSLMCKLQDGSGLVTLRFFHFNAAQKQQLSAGTRVRCYGEVRRGSAGLELYHPEYRVVSPEQPTPVEEHLTPVYPSTEGFSQHSWRKLIGQALRELHPQTLVDLLAGCPPAPGTPAAQVSLEHSLRYLHQPPPDAPVNQLREGQHPFQQRLAFEELLAHHLSLLRLRAIARAEAAPVLAPAPALEQRFLAQLPFGLTTAQSRVVTDIQQDLHSPEPMLRLVQGDVGSGKTVVAALAALQALAAGWQVAIMAPTEILAEQHFSAFSDWFTPLGIEVDWLAGRLKGKPRQHALEQLASGHTGLLIGTHALFQQEVQFARLGLVIIDEQHRFGVHQRLALREKGRGIAPHQLIMTATPIPRTLAMSAYADLDLSVIDELPPGRTPVTTVAIDNQRRQEVVERVRRACREGRQAYWVCTLIEESEVLQCQAAEATAMELANALPELRIGLVHGRLKAFEKAAIMAEFHAGRLDLLVATTVIEVGVNVPNASLMIIENPERLGLAQLHQLRGRVGRGATASFCVLMYESPLSQHGKARLNILRESNDGFVIADKDLELRGPGEVLGTRQTGLMQFRIADLQRDGHLLPAVKEQARLMLEHQSGQVEALIRRWLADNERFANA